MAEFDRQDLDVGKPPTHRPWTDERRSSLPGPLPPDDLDPHESQTVCTAVFRSIKRRSVPAGTESVMDKPRSVAPYRASRSRGHHARDWAWREDDVSQQRYAPAEDLARA